jgi:hypothetical protein
MVGMKTKDIAKWMEEHEAARKPEIPLQYAQIAGKSFDQLKAELLIVYNIYPEYHDPELGGGDFTSMVKKFADDDFYHEHYVAKEYLKLKGLKNG